MKHVLEKLAAASVAFWAAAGVAAPAFAIPAASPSVPPVVVHVASDCHAVGQQVAASEGATRLIKAAPEQRGGQTVCVIVVELPPATDGAHPRRKEIEVPL